MTVNASLIFILLQDNFGNDLPSVEAATKKHEAIETDIKAYEERVNAVVLVATELDREEYHDIERIQQRKNGVLQLWQDLLDLLVKRRKRLELALQLHKVNKYYLGCHAFFNVLISLLLFFKGVPRNDVSSRLDR